MGTGIILVAVFYILSNLFALSFLYYGFKIYTKSYKFSFFVKCIVSYLLFFSIWLLLIFSMSLAYGYTLSLKDILEVSLIFFDLLLPIVILFYLLRIEERGFDYKYLKGFFVSLTIYLISTTFYDLGQPQISGYNFFYSSILNFSTLLILLFIPYTLKIIYNLLINKKQIRYPVIFFGIPISFLLTGTITNGFDKTFSMFIDLILFTLFFNVVTFCYWLKKWLVSDSKKDIADSNNKESVIFGYVSKKISERFSNREWHIEKSEYPLNDEIRNAIENGKHLNIENRNLKQLQFMLICANLEAEDLKDGLNFGSNWVLTGFTLMLVPSIIILISFFNYLFHFQMDLFFSTQSVEYTFQRVFERIIEQTPSRFDFPIRMLISILSVYIFGFIVMSLFSLSEPNSKITSWLKKSKTANGFFEFSLIIIFAIFVIKWIQYTIDIENIIDLDITEILLIAQVFPITIGLMFHFIGSLIVSFSRKMLTNANKIILDLNNKIIFYEE